MMEWSSITTWERALDTLDAYAGERKGELNVRQLSKDSSLIKSYMMETQPNGIDYKAGVESVQKVLRNTDWTLIPLDREDIFRVVRMGEFNGFLEVISNRYFVFHTLRKTQEIDSVISNTVKSSAKLDSVWLAGNYLNLLWEMLIRLQMPERYVSFKFEHHSKFEDTTSAVQDDSSDEDDEENEELPTDTPVEHRSSTLSFTSKVRKVAHVLPELQHVLPDFKAIKMLRFPAPETRGGYDFWDWGKVTYRAPNFREGRIYLGDILDVYRRSTIEIEQRVWFQIEKNRVKADLGYISITGTPVTFVFPEPLEQTLFTNFIETTFVRGQGPFRLWGEPIFYGDQKVHVYGVDLHLWQRIYLELTPKRFIVILPKGTCGNTVHRMISNIQRFISPDVDTYVGDYHYTDLMRDVILGNIGV